MTDTPTILQIHARMAAQLEQELATDVWQVTVWGNPATQLHASRPFPTLETAQAFARSFPKSRGVYATTLSSVPSAGHPSSNYGLVGINVRLVADGVNGGVNETGIKRLRALARRVPLKAEDAASQAVLDAILEG